MCSRWRSMVLLGWNPYLLFDAGFQLSFAAVVAIFLFAKPFTRVLEGYPVHAKLGAASQSRSRARS